VSNALFEFTYNLHALDSKEPLNNLTPIKHYGVPCSSNLPKFTSYTLYLRLLSIVSRKVSRSSLGSILCFPFSQKFTYYTLYLRLLSIVSRKVSRSSLGSILCFPFSHFHWSWISTPGDLIKYREHWFKLHHTWQTTTIWFNWHKRLSYWFLTGGGDEGYTMRVYW
jgi:hypothetical protein